MARVVHSINITASGSCDHADTVADEDLFASFWPEAVDRRDLPSYMTDFAAELNAKPKYVLSSRAPDRLE